MPKIEEITGLLEEFAPLNLQLDWDNSGRQVGDFAAECSGVLLTFDVTERSVETAVQKGANLIISHHPLLFSGLKSITGATAAERIVITAIRNNVAIYSCHTNIDAAQGGVSWLMAEKLALESVVPLSENGMGCLGELPRQMSLHDFAELIKKSYSIPYIKVNADSPSTIRRVAVMGGSGTSELSAAIAAGADAMVTGDAKYHDFQRASNNIALFDVGHYESEIDVVEKFLRIIQKKYTTFALHTEKISFVEIV